MEAAGIAQPCIKERPMIFEAHRLNRAPFFAENAVQGENLPQSETDGGGFLSEFDFPQNPNAMLQNSYGAGPSGTESI